MAKCILNLIILKKGTAAITFDNHLADRYDIHLSGFDLSSINNAENELNVITVSDIAPAGPMIDISGIPSDICIDCSDPSLSQHHTLIDLLHKYSHLFTCDSMNPGYINPTIFPFDIDMQAHTHAKCVSYHISTTRRRSWSCAEIAGCPDRWPVDEPLAIF